MTALTLIVGAALVLGALKVLLTPPAVDAVSSAWLEARIRERRED